MAKHSDFDKVSLGPVVLATCYDRCVKWWERRQGKSSRGCCITLAEQYSRENTAQPCFPFVLQSLYL